ncbi:MAG: hypothetical protein ABIE94_03440 [archaeon]
MGEIKITYETLFDILRRERSREELQQLEESFFSDVAEYLKEKKKILEQSSDQSELFKASEAEKTRIQLHNIRKILKELYEARERKIINRAVNKVKTGSEIIDTSALLGKEQNLFQDMAGLLSKYRLEILIGLVNGVVEQASAPVASEKQTEAPEPPKEKEKKEEIKNPEQAVIAVPPKNAEKEAKSEALRNQEVSGALETQSVSNVPKEEPKQLTVRFMHSLPKFVGRNQEVFGPYAEDDVSSLPAEIAGILVKKGRAEEIKSS